MPLQIESVSPAPGSLGQPLLPVVEVRFNGLVRSETVSAETFLVTYRTPVAADDFLTQTAVTTTVTVEGNYTFLVQDGKSIVRFQPRQPLQPETVYTVLLGPEIQAEDGSSLGQIYRWTFSTGDGSVIQPPADTSTSLLEPLLLAPGPVARRGLPPHLTLLRAAPEPGASHLPPSRLETILLVFDRPLARDSQGRPQFPGGYTLTLLPVSGDPASEVEVVHQVSCPAPNQLLFTLDHFLTPLQCNQLLQLSIPELYGADGFPLAQPLEYYCTTTYNPFYSSARLVRSRVGGYLQGVPDDAINLAIHLASLQADGIIPEGGPVSPAFARYLEHLKARYALVTASLTVLLNAETVMQGSKRKVLGDLEIAWQQSRLVESLVQALQQEQQELEQVLSRLATMPLKPQMTIRGELDPDYPPVGRDFVDLPFTPPVATTKVRPVGSRRWVKTSHPVYPRWWLW